VISELSLKTGSKVVSHHFKQITL